ncbi:hypothetical protein JW930_01190 [Candidatus Woesearchaeota archaeon]|nr:hypothetical protein [Candidatus Woesearchaeota archaeon]
MAFITKSESLEVRLADLDLTTEYNLIVAVAGVNNQLRQELQVRKRIASPRHKWELIEKICTYFSTRGIHFGREGTRIATDLQGINWGPLKPVEYGMRGPSIPEDFLEALEDMERLYFFAGLALYTGLYQLTNRQSSLRHFIPSDFHYMTSYDIASLLIRDGIDAMAHGHNSRPDYKHKIKPTYSSPIRKDLQHLAQVRQSVTRRQRLQREFTDLIETEDVYETLKDDRLPQIIDQINLKYQNLCPSDKRVMRAFFPQRLSFKNYR